MKPKLRPLEITAIEHEGQEYFYFNDRQGLAPGAAIPRAWGGILAFFDGKRDVNEIILQFSLEHGEVLPREAIEAVIAQLDEALLLDSPRFREHQLQIVQEFHAASSRPAALAGGAYPAEAPALKRLLDGFFAKAKEIETPPLPTGAKVRGIVVPHIDFTRGGVTEALAYQQLLDEQFDVFVVLGIAHNGVSYPFCALDKAHETPQGIVCCESDFLRVLQANLPHDSNRLFAECYAHKSEHSVEFVAVFLQHLPQLQNATMVPIICGGFFEELQSGKSPASTREIGDFIEALRDAVSTYEAQGKRVGFIASVDLAHVGSNFGDDTPLTPERLQQIESEDREFLQSVAQGDAEAMHAVLARDNNARNVDAHPAVYVLLKAFPELRAQLLDYRQAYDKSANSVVSFASMTLYET